MDRSRQVMIWFMVLLPSRRPAVTIMSTMGRGPMPPPIHMGITSLSLLPKMDLPFRLNKHGTRGILLQIRFFTWAMRPLTQLRQIGRPAHGPFQSQQRWRCWRWAWSG